MKSNEEMKNEIVEEKKSIGKITEIKSDQEEVSKIKDKQIK